MTHTSTSPNYQIIASLDVGRRQVELEGFEFVQRQVEAAMVHAPGGSRPIRCCSKYFKDPDRGAGHDPAEIYRESRASTSYYDPGARLE